jgi:CHAD domain-containing protein
MKNKPSKSIRSFGARNVLRHAKSLQDEMEGVRTAQDIEAIHRMRVASRRLRTTLSIFSDYFPTQRTETWLKSIRRLTRSLSNARDSDVQIALLQTILKQQPPVAAQPGLRRILIRLQQRRAKQQTQVLQALQTLEKEQTLSQLQQHLVGYINSSDPECSAKILPFATPLIIRRIQELLHYEPFLQRPECIVEHHEMRIATKRLRYTLETFAPCYPNQLSQPLQTLRQLQDFLGQMHDCDVWLQTLPAFIEKERLRTLNYFGNPRPLKRLLPGFEFFQRERQEQRQQTYQELLQSWQTWQTTGFWNELSQIFQISSNTPPEDP